MNPHLHYTVPTIAPVWSQKTIPKSSGGSWWAGKSREQFSAAAKEQLDRMIADARGTVVRLKEGPPDGTRLD